jgi:hypothetical protein
MMKHRRSFGLEMEVSGRYIPARLSPQTDMLAILPTTFASFAKRLRRNYGLCIKTKEAISNKTAA